MDDVLVIQNTNIEGLGLFEHLLKSDGYSIETIQAKQEKIPTKKYSLLIITKIFLRVSSNKTRWRSNKKY